MIVPALLLLSACDKEPSAPDSGAPHNCITPGYVEARVMGDDDVIPGETAVGRGGDFLLVNERAAYVVTAPGADTTYYHYGGIVADALPMEGCAILGDDKLDEVGIVMGQLDLASRTDSILRAFRGERAEILNDGSDGEAAVLRVHGTDDTYWVVEYTLIREAMDEGGRPPSGPLGLEVYIDYILEPDSPVLRAELTLTNTGDEDLMLLSAALLSFGGTLDLYGYAPNAISALGLDLDMGLPWLVATDGEGAIAYSVEEGNLAYMGVSGVDVALDVNQALTSPYDLAPGESDTRAIFLSVGAGGGPTATDPLVAANPDPIPQMPFTVSSASGLVLDPDGDPVAGADVQIEARAPDGSWGVINVARSDADGAFTAPLLAFDEAWEWRLTALADGRHDSEAVAAEPGDSGLELRLSAPGVLRFDILDGDGEASPARLALDHQESGERVELWLAASGDTPVPPGTYDFTATRGFEFAPVTGELEIPDGGEATLDLVMERVVDTTGFVSIDTHVHSWDSPDSRVPPIAVMQKAAAHGLDLVVHTEHEHIVDRSGVPAEAGVSAWSNNITGEEVTATLPEHLTMFPAEPDGSPRGGIVEWYGQDIDQLFAAMRERSNGGVNLLNHPGYLRDIGWDNVLAEPTLDDPTLLGLPPDAAIWSWNLDGLEVMNGNSSPFNNGRWGWWQSMLNAGHPVVAVGCSDSHRGDDIGFPRSYVPSSTDLAAEVDVNEIVEGFRSGALLSSSGAFARVTLGDGAGLGELSTDTDGEVELDLHVEAIPEVDVQSVHVFVNCDEVLSLPASDPEGVIKLSERVTLPLSTEEDAQITVAAFGEQRYPAGLPNFNPSGVPRVLTSPIFVDTDGDGDFTAPGGRECVVFLD